jgi:basic membrane protein A
MVAKGGADLAPINTEVQGGIPEALVAKVRKREKQIRKGLFRVDIDEEQPAGSVVAGSQ